jgi:hypothetical protein
MVGDRHSTFEMLGNKYRWYIHIDIKCHTFIHAHTSQLCVSGESIGDWNVKFYVAFVFSCIMHETANV